MLSSNQVSAAAMTSASEEKWRPFNCFSVQGTGDSPTGPDPENRMGDQDTGSPGRPVSSGMQVPGEPGHCRTRTRPLGELPEKFYLQNVLQLHQQRCVILRADSLALWKIINEKVAVLILKNRSENFSSGFFALGIFWDGVSRYAATPLILVNNPLESLFSVCLLISLLYMFRATQCSSSGETNCINTSSGVYHPV